MFKHVLKTICLTAALALPAQAALAADTIVAPDPVAEQVTALGGTVVWVSGEFGAQKLMQRTEAGGVAPVKGAPTAQSYRSVDLGLDSAGKLVLTYQRCATLKSCKTLSDDLAGKRRSIALRAVTRCAPSTAPAVWRTRMVAGMECRTASGKADNKRSGLYVQTGTGTPKRLPFPSEAVKYNATSITSVDLRGTRAAAITADVYEYAYSVDTTGKNLRAFLAAASEGDSSSHARGLALGTTGTMWTLMTAESVGFPNEAAIYRQTAGALHSERLRNASENEPGFKAIDVAADSAALYLVVPGTGIVRHTFAPES